MKTVQQLMDHIDEEHAKVVELIETSLIRWAKDTLEYARDKYYDSLTYFGYSAMLIQSFGEDGRITIPKEVLDLGDGSKSYRIDQVVNDDGSKTLSLVEVERTENE